MSNGRCNDGRAFTAMDGKSSTIITKLCTLALTFAQKRCETEQEHCQAIACNQEPDPGAKGAGISIAAEAGDTRRGDGSIALSIYAGGSAGRWRLSHGRSSARGSS